MWGCEWAVHPQCAPNHPLTPTHPKRTSPFPPFGLIVVDFQFSHLENHPSYPYPGTNAAIDCHTLCPEQMNIEEAKRKPQEPYAQKIHKSKNNNNKKTWTKTHKTKHNHNSDVAHTPKCSHRQRESLLKSPRQGKHITTHRTPTTTPHSTRQKPGSQPARHHKTETTHTHTERRAELSKSSKEWWSIHCCAGLGEETHFVCFS